MRCLARGGGGGCVLGETLKACCNTVIQFAEFMHTDNNNYCGELSEYWRGQPPPPPPPPPIPTSLIIIM